MLSAQYYERILINPQNNEWKRDTVVVSKNSRILAVMPYRTFKNSFFSSLVLEKTCGAYLPALINAHTHLDINYLYQKTIRGKGFLPWVRSVIQENNKKYSYTDNLEYGLSTMQETIYSASISSVMELSKILSQYTLFHTLFLEKIGYIKEELQEEYSTTCYSNISFAGHALYSTSPDIMKKTKEYTRKKNNVFTLHLSEHEEELQFLHTGKGEFAELLQERLVPKSYKAIKKTPVKYADSLSLLDNRTIAVHCVHLSKKDITILSDRNVFVCLCPRSNEYISVGKAPYLSLKKAKIPLCLGTDSLASNDDLSLWNEARFLRKEYQIQNGEIFTMITTVPAKALCIQNDFGTIEKGKYKYTTKIPEDFL
ncbi:MAG: amidohydrolase family protein [Desulfovibrionaceae bacterium]